MIWILLVVLTVIGGVSAIGIAVNERKKSLAGGAAPGRCPRGAAIGCSSAPCATSASMTC